MAAERDQGFELSPTSQGEESDTLLPSTGEPEPQPGVDGQPVRCTSHCFSICVQTDAAVGFDVSLEQLPRKSF